MTRDQEKRIKAAIGKLSEQVWSGSVAKWCEENIRFNEPKLSGPFSFAGRQYMKEPLDRWGEDGITDLVLCFGTRTGKTRIIFGGLGWRIKHSATRAIWVMPNSHGTGGARNVSKTRFQPMLRASPALLEHIPTGNRRHDFASMQMIVNGSIVDLTGSNSPANLAGNPCDTVIQDEVDKYIRRGEAEADPSALADQRCKEFSTPKRVKTSTPTLVSGKIWQELLKSDLRRRFMPCPHCGKHVIFAWSERFTLLPKTGCEAYIRWDSEAKDENGTWDLNRVMRSAHVECPHCKGKIRDEHKVEMDMAGEWRPTQKGVPGYAGYHLPSMYSVSAETTFGAMSKRFLLSLRSVEGVQNFINSDLAEPYDGQDAKRERTEKIAEQIEMSGDGWTKILTVDCQQTKPHFWYVVRAWKGGNSQGLEAGSCDDWADLEKIQTRFGVSDYCVFVDAGFGRYEEAEVYRNCARHTAEVFPRDGKLPVLFCWMPTIGTAGYKRFRDPETGLEQRFVLRETDPYRGTHEAGTVALQYLEFATDPFKDFLERLRRGKTQYQWTVVKEMATEEYWRHLDGEIKPPYDLRKVKSVAWQKRARHWPNHLFDCEVLQVLAAFYSEQFTIEDDNGKKDKDD